MKVIKSDPPRQFMVGLDKNLSISDCAQIILNDDEQVTFVNDVGGEYDVTKKSWGFYATPSINGRLLNFSFKVALVRNSLKKYYVMIVENGKEDLFHDYLRKEKNEIIVWLSDFK